MNLRQQSKNFGFPHQSQYHVAKSHQFCQFSAHFRRYNKTLLPWMTDSLIDALHHLRAEKHGIQSQATQEIKRLNGGPFLGKILLNFLQHANGTLEPEVCHTG